MSGTIENAVDERRAKLTAAEERLASWEYCGVNLAGHIGMIKFQDIGGIVGIYRRHGDGSVYELLDAFVP